MKTTTRTRRTRKASPQMWGVLVSDHQGERVLYRAETEAEAQACAANARASSVSGYWCEGRYHEVRHTVHYLA